MATKTFIPRDFSLRPHDLIPPEEGEETLDSSWQDYCAEATQVNTDDLMLAVSEAFSETDVLRRIIDDIKRHPFTPGERRHLHVSDCLALGETIATLIDQAMDEAIGMRTGNRESQ